MRQHPQPKSSSFPWLLTALLVYLLPLLAIFVDEQILNTFWFAGNSPVWVKRLIETIYPFFKGLL